MRKKAIHPEPNQTIKNRFYSSYFASYLKINPRPYHLGYFYDQAWTAWRLRIGRSELKNMLFVEWMCEELLKNHEPGLKRLISCILENSHDAIVRIQQSEKAFFESGGSDDIAEKFSHALRHYKVFFESELRLWGSLPYFFICRSFGVKTKCVDPESFVNLPASKKYHALKSIKTVLARGEIKNLVSAFNNEVRNAGEGHDSYEITDEGTAVLHIIDPKTGLHRGSKTLELSYPELHNLIDLCRKNIWVLKNGIMVFINNKRSFANAVIRINPLKIREIKALVSDFANERWLDLFDFSIDKRQNAVKMKLQYFEKKVGVSKELVFGSEEKYDLIDIETRVKYRDQVLGIIQFLVSLWDQPALPNLEIELFDEKEKKIADLTYEASELNKLLLGKKGGVPKPSSGTMLDKQYKMISTVKVPYGSRAVMEKLIKAKGYTVKT